MSVLDLSPESLKVLYRDTPQHIIAMLKDGWLSVETTRGVFELARGRDADMRAVCELCSSDKRPEIRAMAIDEMVNVLPWADVVRSMSWGKPDPDLLNPVEKKT